ncbi:MAG TPA: hypothetical protein VMZ28_25345, partial [Kofleriaceae bacterium]|nr:hypothetical protein [Kofleriaceae bacterium]
MRTRLSLTTTLLAVCASASLLSCGDNLTPGGGGDIDAADQDPDAAMNPDAPDTGMATPTVGGTLAVFDATVVDPE